MRIIHFNAGAWRARFDDGFTDANVVRAADALGFVWATTDPGATVLVGYGTRGTAAAHATLAGSVLASYGLNVIVASKPTPTSAVAWAAARDRDCAGAVMLTAGHAPEGWGGILVRGADGGPAPAGFIVEVERATSSDETSARGSVAYADLSSAYVDNLLAHVNVAAVAKAAPRVVVDPMYGAATGMLASVIARAGANVVSIHDSGDPNLAGLTPNPIEPWADDAERLVRASDASCGIVVDGDGTRFGLIDEYGRMVEPHSVVSLLLGHVANHVGTGGPRSRVVTTMASSARIRRKAMLLGLETTVVPVGFNRLYDEFAEGDVLLASEEYGGVCLPAYLPERDGILGGLLTLELLASSGRPVSEHVRALEREVGHMNYGHRDIGIDPVRIQSLRNLLPGINPARVAGRTPVAVNHTDGLHLSFDDDSWLMLRPARTQPVVRAYAEAPSLAQREELLQAAYDLATSHI